MKNSRQSLCGCLPGALAVIFFFSFFARGGATAPIAGRGLALPVYHDGSSLAAIIKMDQFSHDHRRLGFFRVTLLPVVVFEGVHLEMQQPDWPIHSTEKIFAALKTFSAGDAFEIRDFQLFFPGDITPRLAARRARLLQKKSGPMVLLEGVTVNGPLPAGLSSSVTSVKSKLSKMYWNASGLAASEDFLVRPQTLNQTTSKK